MAGASWGPGSYESRVTETNDILRLGPPLPRPFLDKDGEHDVEGLAAGGDVAEEDNDVGEAERDVVGRDC